LGKSQNKIQIKYQKLLADVEVTGSATLLSIKVGGVENKILIDCGMLQKNAKAKQLIEMNRLTRDMEDIGHVLITHAHL